MGELPLIRVFLDHLTPARIFKYSSGKIFWAEQESNEIPERPQENFAT